MRVINGLLWWVIILSAGYPAWAQQTGTLISLPAVSVSGVFDPSVTDTPTGQSAWMSFWAVDPSPRWPDRDTRTITTRLAYSDNQGPIPDSALTTFRNSSTDRKSELGSTRFLLLCSTLTLPCRSVGSCSGTIICASPKAGNSRTDGLDIRAQTLRKRCARTSEALFLRRSRLAF